MVIIGCGAFVVQVVAITLILISIRAVTRALLLVDAHTPGGAVGLIGITLLMIGFAFQLVATWV